MIRKYEQIWLKIKQAGEGQWVEVRYAEAKMMQTIINMVQLEKSRANVARRELKLPQFGRLKIDRQPQRLLLRFTLVNSGDSL